METSILHIRPRFDIEISHPKNEIIEHLRDLLEKSTQPIKGKIIDNHIILDMTKEVAHYWSPQLNFRVEQDEDTPSHCRIIGLIGPRPAVWTLFTFIYFFVGFVGFVITSIGISHLLLGEYKWYLIGLPIAILVMLTAYRAGKYGESLANDQIEVLKQFVREATEY